MTGGVARRLEQLDRAVAEQVQLTLQASPLESCLLEVSADVSVRLGRICGTGRVELAGVNDHRRSREVSEPAGVVYVQVGLHQVANRVRRDSEAAELRDAVLRLGHAHAELVRKRAPVCVRISHDREWISTVDNDVAFWVANQEVRHRHLDTAGLERAAAEQVERDVRWHGSKRTPAQAAPSGR
jgi:hypothetical protein